MKDALLPQTPARPHQEIHDVRATHDVANLRFDPVKVGAGTWVVIKITPAPHSGSATVIGAAIDAGSGKLIDRGTGKEMTPDAARSGIIEEGSWELVASLNGPAIPGRGQYSWTEPLATRVHKLEAKHLYMPFAEGGCVLCRYDPAAAGSARFDSVCLIPPDWEGGVKPAYEVVKQNPQLFAAPPTPPQTDQLVRILSGDNSVVATLAFRTLLEGAQVDSERLRAALSQSKGYRRAVFVYLLMRLIPNSQHDMLSRELGQSITSSDDLEEHKAVALGMATTRLLHPESSSSQSLAPPLLTALRGRTQRLAGEKGTDPYLRRLFEVAGLPPAVPAGAGPPPR